MKFEYFLGSLSNCIRVGKTDWGGNLEFRIEDEPAYLDKPTALALANHIQSVFAEDGDAPEALDDKTN